MAQHYGSSLNAGADGEAADADPFESAEAKRWRALAERDWTDVEAAAAGWGDAEGADGADGEGGLGAETIEAEAKEEEDWSLEMDGEWAPGGGLSRACHGLVRAALRRAAVNTSRFDGPRSGWEPEARQALGTQLLREFENTAPRFDRISPPTDADLDNAHEHVATEGSLRGWERPQLLGSRQAAPRRHRLEHDGEAEKKAKPRPFKKLREGGGGLTPRSVPWWRRPLREQLGLQRVEEGQLDAPHAPPWYEAAVLGTRPWRRSYMREMHKAGPSLPRPTHQRTNAPTHQLFQTCAQI